MTSETPTIAMMPDRGCRTARRCSRAARGRARPRTRSGRCPRIDPESRPSAVSALISRRMRSRCVIVSATVSSSSARFPPTSRWMRMAMTAHIRSTLAMRLAESSSASSIGRPSRDSVNTRCSSRRVGSRGLVARRSRGPGRTRTRLASSPRAGSACRAAGVWNLRRRFLRRRCSEHRAAIAAATQRSAPSTGPASSSRTPKHARSRTRRRSRRTTLPAGAAAGRPARARPRCGSADPARSARRPVMPTTRCTTAVSAHRPVGAFGRRIVVVLDLVGR